MREKVTMDEESTLPITPRPVALFLAVSDAFFAEVSTQLGALQPFRVGDVQAAIDAATTVWPLVIILEQGLVTDPLERLQEVAHAIAASIVVVDAASDTVALRDEVLAAAFQAERARSAKTNRPRAPRVP